MTDEIPPAVYAFVDKLADSIGGTAWYRTIAARLAHENGLVPKKPVNPLIEAIHRIPPGYTVETWGQLATDTLSSMGYAVVKVATDEERLIEARELCAMVAEEFGEPGWAMAYRAGDYDIDPEMIAMLAALARRDGVA